MKEQEKQPIEGHQMDSESRIERLANELEQTNKILRKTFSLRMIVFRGLITGLTIVIGSTLIAGILFSTTRALFGDIPYVDDNNPFNHSQSQ